MNLTSSPRWEVETRYSAPRNGRVSNHRRIARLLRLAAKRAEERKLRAVRKTIMPSTPAADTYAGYIESIERFDDTLRGMQTPDIDVAADTTARARKSEGVPDGHIL